MQEALRLTCPLSVHFQSFDSATPQAEHVSIMPPMATKYPNLLAKAKARDCLPEAKKTVYTPTDADGQVQAPLDPGISLAMSPPTVTRL